MIKEFGENINELILIFLSYIKVDSRDNKLDLSINFVKDSNSTINNFYTNLISKTVELAT